MENEKVIELLQRLKNHLEEGATLGLQTAWGTGVCEGYKHAVEYLDWLCKLYGVELN